MPKENKSQIEFSIAIPHTVSITASDNGGLIVMIGCVTMTYTDPDTLLQDLARYLRDPEEIEQQYREICLRGQPEQPTESGAVAPRPRR